MICIREDLIKKEIERDGYKYSKFNLHNSLISKLYNHYHCVEMCENFYDSEPDIEKETRRMYMDIAFPEDGECYSEKNHSHEEKMQAYKEVVQAYKDFECKRIEFCNWQEPCFNGNWGCSQNDVDNIANLMLKNIRKKNVSNKDRLYILYKDDEIRIYWYGRDFKKKDFWFIFKRVQRGKKYGKRI